MKKIKLFSILLIAGVLFLILCYCGWKLIYNSEIEGWDRYKSRNASLYIPDKTTTFKILPKALCWSHRLLVVFVMSSIQNLHLRKAIRNTWAKNVDNATVYFVIGTTSDTNTDEQLLRESNRFDDIIQENYIESPANETLQSIAMLKVVNYFCGNNTEFIFKTSDDSYVNVQLLEKYLKTNRNKNKDLLLGKLFQNVKPVRQFRNKWYSPDYLYLNEVYPNFLAGSAGYLMSSEVSIKLYKTAQITPLFPIPDIYITGICANAANIQPTNDHRFVNEKLCYDPCLMKLLFTIPNLSITDLKNLHYDFYDLQQNYTKCLNQYREAFLFLLVNESVKDRNSFINWAFGQCKFRGKTLKSYANLFWFILTLLILSIGIAIYFCCQKIQNAKYKKLG